MAGRVLSKTNETKLRNALAALTEVLGLLDSEDKAATEAMREAANLGNWLESRLHLMFTEITDGLFGEGRLTREERITCSAAIGDALNAFNAVLAEQAPWLYERSPWTDAPSPAEMTEAALQGEFLPLVERAMRRDGTIPLKVIAPGWGSSGYYAPEVLERDGPAVFTSGLKMFWNHPTLQEETDRPEGDLRNLAAELVSGARWEPNGVAGPGLYADAKVFGAFQDAVNEMAPHIGVSIRAAGRAAQGEAEGRKGPIIQQIVAARSVDFVTEPGAGGRIVEMFEAARPRQPGSTDNGALPTQENQMSNDVQAQLAETTRQIEELRTQNARLQEALLLREAREFAADQLSGASVPAVTRTRLLESLATNPPIQDGQLDRTAFAQVISQAVAQEQAYLSEAAGYGAGRITAMGNSQQIQDGGDTTKRMGEAFGRLGLSEVGVKAAVNGRAY